MVRKESGEEVGEEGREGGRKKEVKWGRRVREGRKGRVG